MGRSLSASPTPQKDAAQTPFAQIETKTRTRPEQTRRQPADPGGESCSRPFRESSTCSAGFRGPQVAAYLRLPPSRVRTGRMTYQAAAGAVGKEARPLGAPELPHCVVVGACSHALQKNAEQRVHAATSVAGPVLGSSLTEAPSPLPECSRNRSTRHAGRNPGLSWLRGKYLTERFSWGSHEPPWRRWPRVRTRHRSGAAFCLRRDGVRPVPIRWFLKR